MKKALIFVAGLIVGLLVMTAVNHLGDDERSSRDLSLEERLEVVNHFGPQLGNVEIGGFIRTADDKLIHVMDFESTSSFRGRREGSNSIIPISFASLKGCEVIPKNDLRAYGVAMERFYNRDQSD